MKAIERLRNCFRKKKVSKEKCEIRVKSDAGLDHKPEKNVAIKENIWKFPSWRSG